MPIKSKKKFFDFDVSNKMIAAFVLLAVIISLASIFTVQKETSVSIYDPEIIFTGMVGTNQTIGNVTAEISSYTYINFTNLSISFGSGYVSESASICNLTVPVTGTAVTSGCSLWTTTGKSPLMVENLGNQDVTLNLSFSSYGAALFGGTGPIVAFQVGNGANEASACMNNSGGYGTGKNQYGGSGGLPDTSSWQVLTSSNQNFIACHWWNSSTAQNEMHIGIQFGIPRDAGTGTKTLTITAYGRTCDGTQGSRVNCTATYNTTIY